ncbi:tail completion protein gp17 [Caulobacter sp. DWR3-1-2]|uniref:tail completion protein gp17 n=1 Tax=Caulobacter sp. DWR3-1-2 TaxID=2804647 RepID=UPI003CEA3B91
MEETLIAYLLASPSLVALIGDRLTPGVRTQGALLPALVFNLVSDLPDYSNSGPTGLTQARIQLDAYGATYAQAKAVARAANARLSGWRRAVGGWAIHGVFQQNAHDTFTNDAPEKIHGVSTDFIVWANAA